MKLVPAVRTDSCCLIYGSLTVWAFQKGAMVFYMGGFRVALDQRAAFLVEFCIVRYGCSAIIAICHFIIPPD